MLGFLLGLYMGIVPPASGVPAFEGKISLVKQTCYDTTYYAFYVKENMVRIDEYDTYHNLQSSYVINTNKQSVLALSPAQKMYTNLQVKPMNHTNPDAFDIIKTQNIKVINGYTCYQWRVKNRSKNTEIAYWVADDHFSFFSEMIKVFQTNENYTEFFTQIPDASGFFPMLLVERTLVRDEKLRFEVVEIKRIPVSNDLFKIPRDYKSLEN